MVHTGQGAQGCMGGAVCTAGGPPQMRRSGRAQGLPRSRVGRSPKLGLTSPQGGVERSLDEVRTLTWSSALHQEHGS